MIRVVLADDQMLMRQGVKGLLVLTEDLRVVGEASDGDEALRLIRAVRPDVALLDVRMPKRSGVEVLKDLRISESLPLQSTSAKVNINHIFT